MKIRRGDYEVFSLSAVDLFASAMGAFVLLAIVLMPDYRNRGSTPPPPTPVPAVRPAPSTTLEHANAKLATVTAERKAIAQQIENARRRAIQLAREIAAKTPAPTNPTPAVVTDTDPAVKAFEAAATKVSFRFLGMKTDRARLLLMIDMSQYLQEHHTLILETVTRVLESLQEDHHEFAILGFQNTSAGTIYRRWPANLELQSASATHKAQAQKFVRELKASFGGKSPLLEAMQLALDTPAEALLLISDGLPNPQANQGLQLQALADRISSMNLAHKEIHAVTVGNYFKYGGATQFMKRLAQKNDGDFMAIAP